MNIKCTKKLLDILKVKDQDDLEISKLNEDIENWHCNIFDYGKIYAILLTNDKTLFSFYIYGFKKNDFKEFSEIIKQHVFKTMLNMGFEQKKFELILESMESMRFSKTDNRGTLASMNQMLPFIHHSLDREDDLLDIIIGLNNIPIEKLKFKTPREEFELLLSRSL